MELHHLVGGSSGPGFSLVHFDLEENKSFIWGKYCHLMQRLDLMKVHYGDESILWPPITISAKFCTKVFEERETK